MAERITDELLLKRAVEGDREAFMELYERHRLPIFRFAYRLVGSVEVAEDVTHDCFLGLMRKPQNFNKEKASLRTYLFAATRNLVYKYFRAIGRETGIEEAAEEPVVPERQQPLGRLLNEELSAQVKAAVMSLPPLQREALVLYEYEGLSLSEIASVVGSDTGAVKARLYRARERLKSLLRSYLMGNQRLNTGREIVTLKEA